MINTDNNISVDNNYCNDNINNLIFDNVMTTESEIRTDKRIHERIQRIP